MKWTGGFTSSLWSLLYTVQVGDPNYPVLFILNLHISSKSARKTLIIACEQENPVYSIMYLTKQSWQPVKCSFTFSKLYGMLFRNKILALSCMHLCRMSMTKQLFAILTSSFSHKKSTSRLHVVLILHLYWFFTSNHQLWLWDRV